MTWRLCVAVREGNQAVEREAGILPTSCGGWEEPRDRAWFRE